MTIFSKLDRALVNEKWLSIFPNSEAYFPTAGISDHCPIIINVRTNMRTGRKPFKFFNFWTKHKDFENVVKEVWSKPVIGTPMFKLHSKLKELKLALKAFNRQHYGGLPSKVAEAKAILDAIQFELQKNPTPNNIVAEARALGEYTQLAFAEEAFYKQKARDNVIKAGDQNTSYFHRKVKAHCSRNNILSIMDGNDQRQEGYEEIKLIFIEHYKKLLGSTFNYPHDAAQYVAEIMEPKLPQGVLSSLNAEITDEEIKNTLFSLLSHKAPARMVTLPIFSKGHGQLLGMISLKLLNPFSLPANF